MHNERAIHNGGSTRPEKKTESRELERPEPNRRKIDCGGEPGERRPSPRGADRRNTGFSRPPSPES